MKILIITNSYPSEQNKYNNSFVHSRAKLYIENNVETVVYVYDNTRKNNLEYIYEGIKVIIATKNELVEKLEKDNYDKIIIHFAMKEMTKLILNHNLNHKPIVIWVHGYEALHWKRRLFNLSFSIRSILIFLKYMIHNISQIRFFKSLIRESNKKNIHFVFVSEWMKNITEKDTKSIIYNSNYSIIPNPINDLIFYNENKESSDRLNVFSLRPYDTRKYANDIVVKTIIQLSKKPFFKEYTFNLYGKGRLFRKTTRKLERFDNVKIIEGFYTQTEIKKLHQQNGIIFIPTRQDSQGVSMCEGISSGLVPITSFNTAIPEFVSEDYGFLVKGNQIKEFVKIFENIYYNKNIYLNKQKQTKILTERLGNEKILKEELKLINE